MSTTTACVKANVSGASQWYPTMIVSWKGGTPAWGRPFKIVCPHWQQDWIQLKRLKPSPHSTLVLPRAGDHWPGEGRISMWSRLAFFDGFLITYRHIAHNGRSVEGPLAPMLYLWRIVLSIRHPRGEGDERLGKWLYGHQFRLIWRRYGLPFKGYALQATKYAKQLELVLEGELDHGQQIGLLTVTPAQIAGESILYYRPGERWLGDIAVNFDGRSVAWIDRPAQKRRALIAAYSNVSVWVPGEPITRLPAGCYLLSCSFQP